MNILDRISPTVILLLGYINSLSTKTQKQDNFSKEANMKNNLTKKTALGLFLSIIYLTQAFFTTEGVTTKASTYQTDKTPVQHTRVLFPIQGNEPSNVMLTLSSYNGPPTVKDTSRNEIMVFLAPKADIKISALDKSGDVLSQIPMIAEVKTIEGESFALVELFPANILGKTKMIQVESSQNISGLEYSPESGVLPAFSLEDNLVSVTPQAISRYDYPVPFLDQNTYKDYGYSACFPTSATMILRYWYPNSRIDLPDVYGAGTQGVGYRNKNFGAPAVGYANVGYESKGCSNGSSDTGLTRIPQEFHQFHIGTFSGILDPEHGATYLRNIWGGFSQVKYDSTLNSLITELQQRPVIINVKFPNVDGHYMVVRGLDTKNQADPTKFTFYINNPSPCTGTGNLGENVAVSYNTLKSWYKGRYVTFQPQTSQTDEIRRNSVVVDNSMFNHIDATRSNQIHRFEVSNIAARTSTNSYVWKQYHTSGKDWLYPEVNGQSATFTPNLPTSGKYEILTKFYGDSTQTQVTYNVHNASGQIIGTTSVDQRSSGFRAVSLGQFDITNGAYVRIANVPASCNLDSVTFQYVDATTSVPAPSNVNGYTVSSKEIGVSWVNPDPNVGVQIYLKSPDVADFTLAANFSNPAPNSAVLANLKVNTTYQVKLRSFKNNVYSLFTSPVSITTANAPPKAFFNNTSYTFATTSIGSTSTGFIQAYNTGGGQLQITNIQRLSGSPDFSYNGSTPVIIGTNPNYANFYFSFRPTSTGSKTAVFRIYTNDLALPIQDITLYGFGSN